MAELKQDSLNTKRVPEEARNAAGLADAMGYASFRDVYLNEAVVASVLRRGGNTEDCVVALANVKAQLLARVMELEAIAPKKIKTPNGKVYVWHCPTDQIPEA